MLEETDCVGYLFVLCLLPNPGQPGLHKRVVPLIYQVSTASCFLYSSIALLASRAIGAHHMFALKGFQVRILPASTSAYLIPPASPMMHPSIIALFINCKDNNWMEEEENGRQKETIWDILYQQVRNRVKVC